MLKYIKYCLLFIIFCVGCISIKPDKMSDDEIIHNIDVNSLKTQEKTYKILNDQIINVYDESEIKQIKYNNDWFIVHKDFIKLCNENQDYIINTYKEETKIIDPIKVAIIIIIGFLSLRLIMFILKKCKKTK